MLTATDQLKNRGLPGPWPPIRTRWGAGGGGSRTRGRGAQGVLPWQARGAQARGEARFLRWGRFSRHRSEVWQLGKLGRLQRSPLDRLG